MLNDNSADRPPPLLLYERGLDAARAGKLTLAWEVFSTLVALDPENERFWEQLALVSPTQLACRCWRRVLEINPANEAARRELEKVRGQVEENTVWNASKSAPESLQRWPSAKKSS